MTKITSFRDDALIALDNVGDAAFSLFNPTLRLGVTGLSRAGKTVFITALIHNLLNGGRLPVFSTYAQGRLKGAVLEPQPDDGIPRFQYENHIRKIIEEAEWPNSTRAISELRLKISYTSASAFSRTFGPGTLTLDIVDYPGEWLLDLPLLGKSYAEWSEESLALSNLKNRSHLAKNWHKCLDAIDPLQPFEEMKAQELSDLFTAYLRACREDETALSTLPPGRFLMPGDLEGSPALTFAPLPNLADKAPEGSLQAMFERRFESYKSIVVKPFFREHFARIDRQIVLVDALQALNAGPLALNDLEKALTDILDCFNHGARGWLPSVFTTRTDHILFAATKADHLHHSDHDRLEALLRQLVDRAIKRAEFSGAKVDVMALAAIRATREAKVEDKNGSLPVVVGIPQSGETIGRDSFDGNTKTAIFPGELPDTTEDLFSEDADATELNFVRFRPPKLEKTAEGLTLSLPHIRLDRALEFLLGSALE